MYATLLATGLAAVIAAADFFLVPFPADLNVLWPQSLAFYPAMAYVAEVVFHLVPLSLLYLVVRSVRRSGSSHRDAVPIVVLGVAVLLEPIFQVLPSVAGAQLASTAVIVFLQVLAFNLAALWLFVRFDFLTAYVFRVIYYLYWHILWGHFRLDILF